MAAHHGKHEYKEFKVSDLTYLSSYVPSHNTYFAIYFTLTGLHALHVIGGAVVMAYLLFFGGRMWRSSTARLFPTISITALRSGKVSVGKNAPRR